MKAAVDEMVDIPEEQLAEYQITVRELTQRLGYKRLGGNTSRMINRELEDRGLRMNNHGPHSYIGHIPEE